MPGTVSAPGVEYLRFKERVAAPLAADTAGRPMTGEDDVVVGQAEQLALDGLEQRVHVSAGQICPPDGTRKQRVACESAPSGLIDETDAARRVSRRRTYFQHLLAEE